MREFGSDANELKQALTDRFFAEMDSALREVGVGDLVVGKKVRKMAEVYFGRATAYTTAMAADELEMQDALARNVFAETDASRAMDLAKWSFRSKQVLAGFGLDDFKTGHIRFEI
jgi:cytochrome b pre-mRNA-processing protein 3